MSKSKTKFSYAQLAFLDWLAEDPESRFAVVATGHYSSKSIALYQIENGVVTTVCSPAAGCKDLALVDRLGGSLEINYSPLVAAKALTGSNNLFVRDDGTANGFSKFMKAIGYTGFDKAHGGLTLLRQTSVPMEWWTSGGQAEFATAKAKRERDRADVGRTIVICSKCTVYPRIDEAKKRTFPAGFRHPIPDLRLVRPSFKARVVRETKGRFYIQEIEALHSPEQRRAFRENNPIRGRAPNQYVERDSVLVDGVKEEAVARLIEIDSDRVESYYQACDVALVAALEPLLSLHNRLYQAEAMHEDIMREAIEAASVKKD